MSLPSLSSILIGGSIMSTGAISLMIAFRLASRLWRLAMKRSSRLQHIVVLVLGDVGRSPRMQYHSVSLADLPADVSLVGFPGEKCVDAVLKRKNIKHHFITRPIFIEKKLPRPLSMPIKVCYQVCQLFWILLWSLPQPDVLLLQNPPCIPTLFVALLAGFLRDFRIVVDWHNFGFTVLAMRFVSKDRHPLVRLARLYEIVLGRFCHGGLCVTQAMQRHLREQWNIEASVLYDRPPDFFRQQTQKEARDLFTRLADEYVAFKDLLSDSPPALVVSSTSWTEDEDFSLLLDAIKDLDARPEKDLEGRLRPSLLFVITGKGPQKAHYEKIIASMHMKRCRVITAWLAAEDYPRLLGSATLGVSLHTSTSGCDLPMKVVDMFGAGLPVCAVGFDCLDELVQHDKNGLVFSDSAELANQMDDLLSNTKKLTALKEGVKEFQKKRWQENWNTSARHLFVR